MSTQPDPLDAPSEIIYAVIDMAWRSITELVALTVASTKEPDGSVDAEMVAKMRDNAATAIAQFAEATGLPVEDPATAYYAGIVDIAASATGKDAAFGMVSGTLYAVAAMVRTQAGGAS